MLAETLPHLPGLKEEGSFAVVCKRQHLALPPIANDEELVRCAGVANGCDQG